MPAGRRVKEASNLEATHFQTQLSDPHEGTTHTYIHTHIHTYIQYIHSSHTYSHTYLTYIHVVFFLPNTTVFIM